MSTRTAETRRRTPEAARADSLAAARGLLMERGPEAITLKAVGQLVGLSHPTLLHHFGSAAQLRAALMASMVRDLAGELQEVVRQLRAGQSDLDRLVDQVFVAFSTGGGARLAAWIVLQGETDQLEPVRSAVDDLVAAFADLTELGPDGPGRVRDAVLFMALAGFGDALVGPSLRPMLSLSEDAGRTLAARLLPTVLAGLPR